MGYLLASALISFCVALFFVRQSSNGVTWGTDSDFDGPQKFHRRPVPRMGGAGIFAAVGVCSIAASWFSPVREQMVLLVACGVPALAYGLAEDITLSVTPRKRLMAAMVSAFLGAVVLGCVVDRTNIGVLDGVLAWSIVSIPLTVFAVAGIANSVNIIDGFNGLASMVCIMMFAAIAYVAYSVGDEFILLAGLCCIGALVGFFVWNFPLGLIFLGDGGAYFMVHAGRTGGAAVPPASASVALVRRVAVLLSDDGDRLQHLPSTRAQGRAHRQPRRVPPAFADLPATAAFGQG
jgi:UDP-N-acetylmuramyl pentapeptide phosphotransferase/UDP-N-acetylglucosamine-1-phosphate transferase